MPPRPARPSGRCLGDLEVLSETVGEHLEHLALALVLGVLTWAVLIIIKRWSKAGSDRSE